MSELIASLSKATALSSLDISKIILTAPRRYKTYSIPKRSGGMREIAQPARELKALQYALIELLLSNLPVHSAATAYRSGQSILDNAKLHAGNTAILKLDFKDFFPSIHAVDWRDYCVANEILDAEGVAITSQILFRKAKREKTLKLSIGAPSSPMLSNILLYRFDDNVKSEAERRNISYTRYADDMTFSGQRIGMLKDMIEVVQRSIKLPCTPKLTLNQNKTNFVTTKYRRTVTGLVLGNDGEVGIGREKLRLLRARVHRALNDRVSAEEGRSLAGYLSFVRDADPAAFNKLQNKYGELALEKLMRQGMVL